MLPTLLYKILLVIICKYHSHKLKQHAAPIEHDLIPTKNPWQNCALTTLNALKERRLAAVLKNAFIKSCSN